MAVKADFTQQSSYKGLLGWNAYTEALNSTARPAVEIELWLKEYSIPIRQPKIQEVATATQFDPIGQRDISTAGIIYGGPDVLQVTMTGFLKTPKDSGLLFAPVDKSGAALSGMSDMTYGDIITMYIEGSLNKTVGGAWMRKDPDYFISPYGNTYTDPVIMSWEPSFVNTNSKLQSFSTTLMLES